MRTGCSSSRAARRDLTRSRPSDCANIIGPGAAPLPLRRSQNRKHRGYSRQDLPQPSFQIRNRELLFRLGHLLLVVLSELLNQRLGLSANRDRLLVLQVCRHRVFYLIRLDRVELAELLHGGKEQRLFLARELQLKHCFAAGLQHAVFDDGYFLLRGIRL